MEIDRVVDKGKRHTSSANFLIHTVFHTVNENNKKSILVLYIVYLLKIILLKSLKIISYKNILK